MSNIVTYEALNRNAQKVVDLVLRKNADYGDAWRRNGVVGVMVRIQDKMLRLENLNGKSGLVVGENARDTLMDICGYALLGLIELEQGHE